MIMAFPPTPESTMLPMVKLNILSAAQNAKQL
jgi:hypothetical protein